VDRRIVSRLGGDPAARLGLDLAREADRGRWLVAACLLSAGAPEAVAEAAFRRLAESGLEAPARLAAAPPGAVARALEQAGHPRPERVAAVLTNACRSLLERHGGSLAALAQQAEGLEDLGARVAALGRGVGQATVHCFLRPLRPHWPAAADLPLSPAAQAAAEHLGLRWDGDLDVEAALERLGRRACLRGRVERCPLGAACPAR
jgi:hypothetical protein